MGSRTFNIWAFGDAHVGTDLKRGRQSLADALRMSEQGGEYGGPPFEWDMAVNVGDMSGGQAVPEDVEGEEIIRQFSVLKKHPREAIYSVCGNHDRSGLDEPPARWWRRWIDPMGKHSEYSRVESGRRPFRVEGTWERYAFRVGNILFLMMSDINEPTQKIGRGDLGGNPGGVVSGETFRWWVQMVESNPKSIIISVHHYMLKDTTVASGEWEGMEKDENGNWRGGYHGYKELGTPQGASFLYFVDSKRDAQTFEKYLSDHPGAVDIWLGGHTHAHPNAVDGGKTHIETKWGTHFINVGALTRYHVNPLRPNPPKSRLLTFVEGANELRVQCYMHTNEFLPQGWYEQAECRLKLGRAFRREAFEDSIGPSRRANAQPPG